MDFEEKFVAFVDVLGFKSMVAESEAGKGMSLPELLENLSKLGTHRDENKFQLYGPTVCPQSHCETKGLNFKITQISDCVIVSSEISAAGVINLINHCWGAVISLMAQGIMCRGYITKGSIYHNDNQIIGSGYQNAYAMEAGVSAFKREAEERGAPFVEVDPVVCDYIKDSTDDCVRKMFSRMVKVEDGVTALFPFKRLSHSFAIGGFGQDFEPEREKMANDKMRKLLMSFKDRVLSYVDPNNEKAMNKAAHYIEALEEQIAICDRTDEMIDTLCQPFPR